MRRLPDSAYLEVAHHLLVRSPASRANTDRMKSVAFMLGTVGMVLYGDRVAADVTEKASKISFGERISLPGGGQSRSVVKGLDTGGSNRTAEDTTNFPDAKIRL